MLIVILKVITKTITKNYTDKEKRIKMGHYENQPNTEVSNGGVKTMWYTDKK